MRGVFSLERGLTLIIISKDTKVDKVSIYGEKRKERGGWDTKTKHFFSFF